MTPEVKYLSYRLTLKAPAIVTTLSGDPNSTATQRYIPGSTIRGAVAARLLRTRTTDHDPLFRRLVLSDEVRYLNAYPEIDSARSLPIPASWRQWKYHGHDSSWQEGLDLAAWQRPIPTPLTNQQTNELWPRQPLTAPRAPFCSAETYGGSFRLVSPACGARLHQQRDRLKGRPWSEKDQEREIDHGTIFAYEYLQPYQSFRGVVQIWEKAWELEEELREIMTREPLLLGRSRRGGYGGMAEVKCWKLTDGEYPYLVDAKRGAAAPGDLFRALLVSPYLGRDPRSGQLDPTVLAREIELRLRDKARVKHRFWRFQTVGGFNRKWRLPLPQALAVAPGAVLVLEAKEEIPAELLQEVVHQGLGLRRNEGFGRLVFLEHPATDSPAFQEHRDRKPGPKPGEDTEAEEVRALEERIVLNAARAELERRAHLLAQETKNIPPNSLLGRLRTLLRPVRDRRDPRTTLQKLRGWCRQDDPKLAPPALQKLEECRVNDPAPGGKETNLRQWLQAPCPQDGQDGGACWAFLRQWGGLEPVAESDHLTSPQAAETILQENSALLAVYLVDNLLAALVLRNRREEP